MDKKVLVIALVLLLLGYWIFSGDSQTNKVNERELAATALDESGCKEGHDVCALKEARERAPTDVGGAAFFCRSVENEALEDQCHFEVAVVVAEQGAYPSALDYCTTLKNANPTYTKEACKRQVLEIENRATNP